MHCLSEGDSGTQWRQRQKPGDTKIPEWLRAAEPLCVINQHQTVMWLRNNLLLCLMSSLQEWTTVATADTMGLNPASSTSQLCDLSPLEFQFSLGFSRISPNIPDVRSPALSMVPCRCSRNGKPSHPLTPPLCPSPRISARGLCLVPGHRIWLIHEYLALRFN